MDLRDPEKNATMTRTAERLGETAAAMYFSKQALDTHPTRLPEEPSSSDVVYRHIHDLRLLDSNPRLNLASYVTTWMEEPAVKLITESLSVNHVDANIYQSSSDIENKCVQIMANLFHVPDSEDVVGCATSGSTEGCLLGGLNMKKRWAGARRAKGLPTDKPNVIICYDYQVCWKKFSNYFDVELRLSHVREGCYTLRPEDVEDMADENTIGVVCILGSTYTGHFDDVQAIDAVCEKLRATRGLDLMIHVDGASGGMVAPFLDPDLKWDFRLKNVISICTSGHKYGFVYCGIGWVVWRNSALLHPDLVFHLTYLGSEQTNLTLNFSRPASHIVASYYQFLRLGREGFSLVVQNMEQVACYLADGIRATGAFRLLNNPRKTVPMVAFTLLPYGRHAAGQAGQGVADGPTTPEPAGPADGPAPGTLRPYTEFEFAEKLKECGWSVPAYKMPPDLEEMTVCRCVVREDFSITLADRLLKDMRNALDWLDVNFAERTREQRDHAMERIKSRVAPSNLHTKDKMHVVC